MAMKILMGKYFAIATADLKGQIFELNHYHKHLQAAYYRGPLQQLIPLDELEPINMPFPYWRRQKDECLESYPEPGTIECDTLPVQEQINLCRERINLLQLSLSVCKKNIKKYHRKNEEQYLTNCKLHDFISKEIRQENRFILLLKRIVPNTPLSLATKQKIEQDFIAKHHKLIWQNVRNLFQTAASDISQNLKLSLSEVPENFQPDIHIRFENTQGYLTLAYFPGEDSISSDILLSQEFLAQPQQYQNFIVWHEIGHALGLAHEHDRTDSVMGVNLETGVESLPQRFTPYDFWALDTTYYNVY